MISLCFFCIFRLLSFVFSVCSPLWDGMTKSCHELGFLFPGDESLGVVTRCRGSVYVRCAMWLGIFMMGSWIATFYVFMFKQRLASIHLMRSLSFGMALQGNAHLTNKQFSFTSGFCCQVWLYEEYNLCIIVLRHRSKAGHCKVSFQGV